MIYPTPKITISSTDYIINNSYCDPVFTDPQVYEGESTITGKRLFELVGERSHFVVFVYIEKRIDPKAALLLLRSFLGVKAEKFYVDKDGRAVRARKGGDASFYITRVEPLYIDNLLNYTYIIMRLDSTDYIRPLTEPHTYWVDKDETFITTKDGKKIIF